MLQDYQIIVRNKKSYSRKIFIAQASKGIQLQRIALALGLAPALVINADSVLGACLVKLFTVVIFCNNGEDT
jgi:hypothetical protein